MGLVEEINDVTEGIKARPSSHQDKFAACHFVQRKSSAARFAENDGL